jgi:hypothetical protein
VPPSAANARSAADADPGRVEQRHDLLCAGAGRRDEADRSRLHGVREAQPQAADHGRAAVRSHHQHVLTRGELLESNLLLDGDVVAEHYDARARLHRIHRLREGRLTRH